MKRINNKKTIMLSSIILGALVLTLGIAYAIFSYQQTGNNISQLIMGDIYMHYKENNQLKLNNAMPQEGFKTVVAGYSVNPIMESQDASDTTTELYACINLFQNELKWGLDEGEDFESFCRGTGTNGDLPLQMYLDNGIVFIEDDYNTMLSLNIIQEETLEYTSIKLNPEIKTQKLHGLTMCVTFFDSIGINGVLDEGATTETFCQGTGTIEGGVTLQQFWDANYQQDGFMEFFGNTLINNNVMVLENDLYIVNPDMTNQTVGEINDLTKCAIFVTNMGYEFDEGTTAESFCKGEGTYNSGITLTGEFEEKKDYVDFMTAVGSKLLENNIIIASVDLPYFEFTISGKNTYSKKDIYYDIILDYGDPHETRNTRIEDEFLKFRLVEVNPDKTEQIIFDNKSYSSIENKIVHAETIKKNTMNEINKTYRLYMWIDEDVVICGGTANDSCDYYISGDTNNWNDIFASVKINVTGDFNVMTDFEVSSESCFTFEEMGTYISNSDMQTQPLQENELSKCITYFSDIDFDEGSDVISYCQGTGTAWDGWTFQMELEDWMLNNDDYFEYLTTNNIIVQDGDSYIVNPIMATQELNELSTCVSFFKNDYYSVVDENETIESFCRGTGTQTLQDSINEADEINYSGWFSKKKMIDLKNHGVVEFISSSTYSLTDYDASCGSDVVIPKMVDGMLVTEIADGYQMIHGTHHKVVGAMSEKGLTSVVIPDSVTKIGDFAFRGNNLIFVEIPDSVTTIGDSAFSFNQLASVTIPNSVTTIEEYAFSNNQLTSVTIPNSVTTIGREAFSFNQLASVTIPNSVTTIEEDAFSNNQLTSVTIPNSVTTIGREAFTFNQLTRVTIPNSVTTIEKNAFSNNQLTSVTIQNGVTTIEEYAFSFNQLTRVTIPNSVIRIDSNAFAENQLETVIIGSGIEYIGRDAFTKNYVSNPNLESITFKSKMCEEIKNMSFFPWLDSQRPYYIAGYKAKVFGTDGECVY